MSRLPVNKNHDDDVLSIPLYDIEEDFELIYGDYSKVFDFYDDFYNLPLFLFELRVSSLDGRVKDILELRYRFLKSKKMTKEEKKAGYKSLNSKQLDYVKEKQKQVILDNIKSAPSKALNDLIKRKGG